MSRLDDNILTILFLIGIGVGVFILNLLDINNFYSFITIIFFMIFLSLKFNEIKIYIPKRKI